MKREELGLFACCYMMQYLAEGSELSNRFPMGWNNVGKAAQSLGLSREAACYFFEGWQKEGLLDKRSTDPMRCQLTSSGHLTAQNLFAFRRREVSPLGNFGG